MKQPEMLSDDRAAATIDVSDDAQVEATVGAATENTPMPTKDIPLSVAAEELGVAHTTLATQARLGRFKAWKVGPIWVTNHTEIERYRLNSLGQPGRRSGTRDTKPRARKDAEPVTA